jgi:hypothetical protein
VVQGVTGQHHQGLRVTKLARLVEGLHPGRQTLVDAGQISIPQDMEVGIGLCFHAGCIFQHVFLRRGHIRGTLKTADLLWIQFLLRRLAIL